MSQFLRYQKARFREAWKRTWRDFAPTREHIPLYLSIWVVSVALQWGVFGKESVSSELPKTLVISVGGIAGAFLFWLLVNIFLAPFRLWQKEKDRIQDKKRLEFHQAVAKELEAHIQKGQKLLGEFVYVSNNPDVAGWRKEAEEIVKKCGDGELVLFKTLFPPSGDEGLLQRSAANVGERDILKGLNAKLRKIMTRQLQLANAPLAED